MALVERAIEFFQGAGIKTMRILADNGPDHRPHVFCDFLADRGIEVRKTRPYHPGTNGKAKTLVKIITNEWAYGCLHSDNAERAAELGPFPKYYDVTRPHGGIGYRPPISRVS